MQSNTKKVLVCYSKVSEVDPNQRDSGLSRLLPPLPTLGLEQSFVTPINIADVTISMITITMITITMITDHHHHDHRHSHIHHDKWVD